MKIALIVLPVLVLASSNPVPAREAKELDNDINYDDRKTPHYDLPPLLVTTQGRKITTA